MKQYTINGFADLLVGSTQFKKLKTREKKLLLLDRCNWYISSIVKQNVQEDKPYGSYVNLNSQLLKKFLGDRIYKDIQLCLVGLGVIIENTKYSTTKFSKSFCLTPKAVKLGVIETYIYSKKIINKSKKEAQLNYDDSYSNPILKKIIDNTLKLVVVEDESHYVLNILPEPKYVEFENQLVDTSEQINQFKLDRYNAYYSSFVELNEVTDPRLLFDKPIFYTPSIAASGRIYHIIASMPKYIRESMRVKPNELIWEVDMCSAQPSIVFLEWLSYAKKNFQKSMKDEYDLCLKLLLEGRIYQYVKDNSLFFKTLEYQKLKVSILSVLNAENKPTEPNKELTRLFPNVMQWVNNIKKESGYKRMSFIGQSTEAKIFVKVYKEIPNEKFALLIHDCILVIKEDVELVEKSLENRIRELYTDVIFSEHNLDKLFKASLVSISDDKLNSTQREKYFKKTFEEGILN